MDPAFWLDAFPLDGETLFLFIYEKLIYCLENDLESPLIFVLLFIFIFLKVNKIRKKTLSMTPHLEKGVCEKSHRGSRVRLLVGNVR